MRRVRKNAVYHVAMRRLETDLIRWYLRESEGNIRRAAEALGVPYNFVYRRLERLGLNPTEEATAAGRKPKPNVDRSAS